MLRSIFLRGTETTMPIWNWIMASSQQSQVPIIFSLATIVLAVVLPLLAGVFWLLFAKMDNARRVRGRQTAALLARGHGLTLTS